MNNFKIAISGGKGGVGKSMLSSSLLLLFNKEFRVTGIDCDVDVPNLAIWLNEVDGWDQSEQISVSKRPVISDSVKNLQHCVEECRFNALEVEESKLKLNRFLCEGCGACQYFCSAIKEMKEVKSGWIKTKQTKYSFPLVSGQLKTGEAGSGKIVTEIKRRANAFESDLQIIDSAPGTGCPVVAALQDVDFVVLVTEPSKSGLSDLKNVKEIVDHFKLNYGVVVNKWNINEEIHKQIKGWSQDNYLGKINYDQKVINSISKMKPVMETDLDVKSQIEEIFLNIKSKI